MSHTTHPSEPALAPAETLHSQATELLQELIRCACVNDGTPDSGQEIRAVRVLQDFLAGVPVEYEIVEPHPGRASLVARIKGSDPTAESLALVGHLDVVPVNDVEWTLDPFGAEILDGRIWGRGAVDMLFLTASYAVVFRALLASGVRPAGDIVFAAVADEESGSRFGAGWLSEHRWDLIGADNVLSEWGGAGLGSVPGGGEALSIGVGEKGGAGRKLLVRGRSGHGSVPWGSQNAATLAAVAVQRIAAQPPSPVLGSHWLQTLDVLKLPAPLTERLSDPATLVDALPEAGELAPFFHAWTHTTISPNILTAGTKANVIPGAAEIVLDIRVLPGTTEADVDAYLCGVLADLPGNVTVADCRFSAANVSSSSTRLYGVLEQALAAVRPDAVPVPVLGLGGSDSRFFRRRGASAYGFGVFSAGTSFSEVRNRFHGADEHIDLASLGLTVAALEQVVRRFSL